jgi:hypothetical protein
MGFLTRLFGARRHDPATLIMAFPYEVITLNGTEAVAALTQLRTPEHTPVLIGDAADLECRLALLEQDTHTMDDILKRVQSIGGSEWWFTARGHALEECYEETLGAWPETPTPFDTVQAVLDPATGRPRAKIYCALLPTAHSWEAPAFFRFGGWSDCPFAEEHVAVARTWQEEFGAEIIAMTDATLEFAVSRPPTTRAAAEELAMKQFAYCGDIVTKGTGSIRHLAASLLEAPYWFFWWERPAE